LELSAVFAKERALGDGNDLWNAGKEFGFSRKLVVEMYWVLKGGGVGTLSVLWSEDVADGPKAMGNKLSGNESLMGAA
jgi:hypothetical protein